MTSRTFMLVLAVILAATTVGTSRAAGEIAAPASMPDEVILKFDPSTNASVRNELLARLGAKYTTSLGRTGALLVKLATPTAWEIVFRHAKDPALAYIEPNFIYEAALVPNDTWFPQQWSLFNTGQTGGTPGADIHAPAAWDLATGLPSVVIGFLDSGIDFAHPDLVENLYVNPGEIPDNGVDDDANGFVDDVHGWDFVDDDNDPMDDNGHGTLGAGIAGAVVNNGIGIAGVCWRVSLLPIKFLDATGTGTTANAIRALDYAITMGVPITNNSWGGGGFSQALLDAILAAEQAGVLFVASAGASSANLDEAPTYPASYDAPNILTVTATDDNDQLASFSNYGEKTVDLAAPGVDIPTTHLGSTYFVMSGTSAATAHCSGALALVLSRFPGISALSAATHLIDHTEKVPSLTGLVRTGRLDAYGPLGETPTDVSERPAATVGENRQLRLWWKSSSREEARLVLYLPFADRVQLTVFDVRGRRVRQLFAGPKPAGFQEIAWDARGDRAGRVARGVYLVNLHGSSSTTTTRVFIGR